MASSTQLQLAMLEQLGNLQNMVSLRINSLRDQESYWKELYHLLETKSLKTRPIITLDMRGEMFALNKTSVFKFKESYLYALITSVEFNHEEASSQHFFIDRNPQALSMYQNLSKLDV